MNRSLDIVGIAHTDRDMGRLSDDLRSSLDSDAHATKQAVITSLWDAVEAWADRADIGPGTKLYQDGLPVCDHERRIVQELAAQGIRNHVLLERLLTRGAVLVGTEDPALLIEELALARRLASGEWTSADERDAERLLEARDRAIAQRIDQTLEPGERGIVFLGLLHDLPRHLAEDIKVRAVPLRLEGAHERGAAHEH